ncbi:MAG: glycosyltransferase [Anaerolineales bacterium]|nr:glycosyltransferase [Anaerolineales bacterium]
MTKLIIQIPCFNEANTLPAVLAEIPTTIPGIDIIETLVIDDGSSDDTVEVARRLGVDHIVRHTTNKRLARAFQTGLDTCLKLGADIIVNTDGDNQYPGRFIPDLIAPVLQQEADVVVSDRQTRSIEDFSPLKKFLSSWGSWVVRKASGTCVADAPSGFRAYSREAALRLNVLTSYTYTLETIIQAGKKGLKIISVPIEVNPKSRESRLIKNNWSYVKHSAATILRLYAFYEPLRSFLYISAPFFITGSILLGRFGYYYLIGERGVGRFLQSLFIGGISILIGVLIAILGILADISATNRQITEETLFWLKKRAFDEQSGNDSGQPFFQDQVHHQ